MPALPQAYAKLKQQMIFMALAITRLQARPEHNPRPALCGAYS